MASRLQLQVSLRRSGVGESGVSSAPLMETESVRGDLFKNSKWHREKKPLESLRYLWILLCHGFEKKTLETCWSCWGEINAKATTKRFNQVHRASAHAVCEEKLSRGRCMSFWLEWCSLLRYVWRLLFHDLCRRCKKSSAVPILFIWHALRNLLPNPMTCYAMFLDYFRYA